MAITLTLPDTYGYSVLVALGVLPILSLVQGSVVTSLRKPAGVPYPNAYASPEHVKTSKEAYKFNCAQRAHGNLMENMPQTMALILFNGLFFPRAAPALGLMWAVFRGIYAYGYVTSDKPDGKGRAGGGAFWLAQLGLLGMAMYTGFNLL